MPDQKTPITVLTQSPTGLEKRIIWWACLGLVAFIANTASEIKVELRVTQSEVCGLAKALVENKWALKAQDDSIDKHEIKLENHEQRIVAIETHSP